MQMLLGWWIPEVGSVWESIEFCVEARNPSICNFELFPRQFMIQLFERLLIFCVEVNNRSVVSIYHGNIAFCSLLHLILGSSCPSWTRSSICWRWSVPLENTISEFIMFHLFLVLRRLFSSQSPNLGSFLFSDCFCPWRLHDFHGELWTCRSFSILRLGTFYHLKLQLLFTRVIKE